MSYRNILLGNLVAMAIMAGAFVAHVYTTNNPNAVEIRDYISVSLTWLLERMPPVWLMLLACVGGVVGAFGGEVWKRTRKGDAMNENRSRLGDRKTETLGKVVGIRFDADEVRELTGFSYPDDTSVSVKKDVPLPFPVGCKVRLKGAFGGQPVGTIGEITQIDVTNGQAWYHVRGVGVIYQDNMYHLLEVVPDVSSGKPVCKEWDTPAKSEAPLVNATVLHEAREGMRVRRPATDAVGVIRRGYLGLQYVEDGGETYFGCFTNGYLPDWLEPIEDVKAEEEKVLAREGMRVRHKNGKHTGTIRMNQVGEFEWRLKGSERLGCVLPSQYLPDWLEEVQEPATQAGFDPATAGDYGDVAMAGDATITYVDVEKESLRAEVARLKEQLEAEYKRWNGVYNALGDYRLLAEEPADAIRRLKTEFLHLIEARGDVKALREEVERLKASEGELVVTLRQNIIHWQAKCREAEERCRTLEAIASNKPKSPVGRIEEHLWKMLNEDNLLDQHKIDVMDRLMEIERMKADSSI